MVIRLAPRLARHVTQPFHFSTSERGSRWFFLLWETPVRKPMSSLASTLTSRALLSLLQISVRNSSSTLARLGI